jgi:hypothetical protein
MFCVSFAEYNNMCGKNSSRTYYVFILSALHNHHLYDLISGSSQHSLRSRQISSLLGLALLDSSSLLLGIVGLLSDLALSFKLANKFGVAPSDLLGKITENSEVAVSSKAKNLQGSRNDNSLLLVIRLRDTLESGKAGKSNLSADSLVRQHTAKLKNRKQ